MNYPPGNPGLLGFYPDFLSTIHEKASSVRLAILAHAHVGHTPGIEGTGGYDARRYDLPTQIHSAVEALDAVKAAFGAKTKVVILGHSIGSWFTLQVLKARPDAVDGVFLLFPTISFIGDTPNGRSLSWLMRPPMPRIISAISPLARVPASILSMLFASWPRPQISVLHALLFAPTSIYATLSMAHDEMNNVRDLDIALLTEYKDRIWFYYAEKDNWVGEQKELVLRSINAEPDYVRVVHGHREIPHAFCISMSTLFVSFDLTPMCIPSDHGKQVASQCFQWLLDGGFLL
ncbi:hypothetical protein HWV62_33941 [Athelia sp. TMB]|nr:hypothetical protein HWV62_33941 [Athelia sp. TMB]